MDTYFHGIWRMDWGLGNPNKTAALIAILMVAVWGLVYVRRYGFWLALTLFTGLGVCLIRTFSRGGMIALFAGLLVLAWKASRPWPRKYLWAVSFSVWTMIGVSIFYEAHARYGQSLVAEDRSIGNRLLLWRQAPRMMTSAPQGWGLGTAGKNYMRWYQPVERKEEYRTLVNSHLTWLVEFGWLFRFAYLFAWPVVFLLVLPTLKRPWFIFALGVWTTFAVAAWFSSVAESPWIWIVPMGTLLTVLVTRAFDHEWPRFGQWVQAGCVSLFLVAVLFLAGRLSGGLPIQAAKHAVVLGKAPPSMWMVVNEKTMGGQYGREIRRRDEFLRRNGLGVVESVDQLPRDPGKVVVIGGDLSEAEREQVKNLLTESAGIILLNPLFSPQELGVASGQAGKIKVFFGEFAQTPVQSAWADLVPVGRIEGDSDYVSHWPERILSPST
ncbi:MAG: O-antigen ligase family protein [Verrucomicrobiae bacterium]|nr:O-antigen ligase family protein [Verrucomicrobiae bacterium]